MARSDMRVFRFWCQKVLPLVYDDSLSYYEVLCKITEYVNSIIEDDKAIIDELEELKSELAIVQKWIDDFDTSFIEKIVDEYIAKVIKNVYFGLTTDGYFIAYIPSGWDGVQFGTVQEGDLYGHLTLEYD